MFSRLIEETELTPLIQSENSPPKVFGLQFSEGEESSPLSFVETAAEKCVYFRQNPETRMRFRGQYWVFLKSVKTDFKKRGGCAFFANAKKTRY